MLTRDFDYELPEDRIATTPAPRGTSRLLVLPASGSFVHHTVADLPALLTPGDLLVVNDTRVIPARLLGERLPGRGRAELFLLRRELATADGEEWTCLVKPGRKLQPGARIDLLDRGERPAGIAAEILAVLPEGQRRVRFAAPLSEHLDAIGHVPLPPYIRRAEEEADRERYQTVYARAPGAVAAPTAGLHLSRELLAALSERGIGLAALTLHVGLGTFKPVTVEDVRDHQMEEERYEISEAAAEAITRTREAGGRIVAVGTTVVRTLETAAQASGRVVAGSGGSRLFITPGFTFRAVDRLLTNFHLPRSTLLMLVAAFAGHERVLAAYRAAIAAGYRFYSYGDAMLVDRIEAVGG